MFFPFSSSNNTIPQEQNEYVFIVDDDGSRITSLLIGIHGLNKTETIQQAKDLYPGKEYFTGTEKEQQLFYENYKYIGGKMKKTNLPPTENNETIVVDTAPINVDNVELLEIIASLREELDAIKGDVK